eukprot:CAMPEP_0184511444 /NCGR_PEP_ID=MMETSP0198_2-20121128/2353_1 /TAXON_ID=1112570 /ORGANISM="Thraustochytrium sp., Strain LLF1b" /LENGTH=106 /DNA_ID=CAMNT_0026901407 /DNA_START=91 /DNA_END=411 /DNA_ORIENTATION=-
MPGPRTEEELLAERRAQLEAAARMQSAKERKLTELLAQGDFRALTLMNQISQTTFDEAVKENMEEFGLSREEAIEEAIKEFETQGAGLDRVDTQKASQDKSETKKE